MTRIISGDFRGRELKVPKTVTRPTSSRVREAIFSAVDHAQDGFDGLRVLDLYAGSGACALESISRGAKDAVAIEKDVRAAQVIKDNAATLKVNNLTVVSMDASTALHGEAQLGSFDVVFIDPPYSLSDQTITTELELLSTGWLNNGALVVVERDKKSQFEIPANYEQLSRKVYGDTSVWYGRY